MHYFCTMHITNPAFNYDQHGQVYSGYRQTEPAIAAYINDALGNGRTVLNVGAGAGSYEPSDRYVVAIEPSAEMRRQRLATGKLPAIDATAAHLPFDDNSFDASMAMVTVHHWPNIEQGLQEMKRVTKDRILIMTFDPDVLDEFWNVHYFPELVAVEKARYPKIERLVNALGGQADVIKIPVPLNCIDGFQEAFYGRPEAFLQKEVRQAQSAWGFLPAELEDELVQRLQNDLSSGEWDKRFGHYRTQENFTCALRLIVAKK